MSSIVHTISDRMPGTASGPPLDAFTASRRAYSGLVPMSPKTTPSDPSASAQKCLVGMPVLGSAAGRSDSLCHGGGRFSR